ncbi:Lipoprotein releasing system transmembrane protein LolC/LolE [hydrothermal vent metagenome]|uniref:Lipoprotein releasing system transmembrane protein LolC/LolE n=1 Tax=hydrothermal vent metagenome TaxID=652676 RepID=A0A3B1DFY4_9ZZZZ
MYKFLLCTRYLRSRYIALASIISVTLGVATMIVVNSVMAGFSTEMRDRIHGILADVIIESDNMEGVYHPEKQMSLIRQVAGDKVEAMTATVEVFGMLSFQYGGKWRTRPVKLIGIDPEGKGKVGPLKNYLVSYKSLKENGVIIEPPQRQLNEPLGWKLTEKAMARRRRRVERQQYLENRIPHHQMQGKEVELKNPFASKTKTQEKLIAKKEEQPVNPSEQFNVEPEFPSDQTPIDPAALLKGRLYVASGIVSFMYRERDDETGEVKNKTVMLVRPGDDVKISTVSSGRPPEATHFNATVVDLFKSGMSEYDSRLVYCNLEYLQEVRGMIDPESGSRAITSIQLKLRDFDDAQEVIKSLRAAFPVGVYRIQTWEQKQGALLAAVEMESGILNVLLFMIIAVAGFGILAIFFMIVVEKTRDIGVLKALGASSRGVMAIFLSYGLGLGIVGSGVGAILGLTFVKYINEIEGVLAWVIGRKVFDEKIYYFPEIPTSVNPMMVLWVSVGAMAIAVLASIFPARRAAQLRPVEALRYDG